MAAPSQQLNFRQIDSKLPRAAAADEPFAFHYSTKNAKRPNRAQCRARIETYWSLRCKEVKMCDFLVRSIFANNTRAASSRKEARATVESRAEAKEEKKTGRRTAANNRRKRSSLEFDPGSSAPVFSTTETEMRVNNPWDARWGGEKNLFFVCEMPTYPRREKERQQELRSKIEAFLLVWQNNFVIIECLHVSFAAERRRICDFECMWAVRAPNFAFFLIRRKKNCSGKKLIMHLLGVAQKNNALP